MALALLQVAVAFDGKARARAVGAGWHVLCRPLITERVGPHPGKAQTVSARCHGTRFAAVPGRFGNPRCSMTDDKPPPLDLSTPPTSFTSFKPVGHIVIGFPDDDTCGRAVSALEDAGIGEVQQIPSDDMRSKMAQMLDMASGSAEFGHEIVEMRKYLALSAVGYGWLIAPAADDEAMQHIVLLVEPIGARVAVNYGRLLIQDVL